MLITESYMYISSHELHNVWYANDSTVDTVGVLRDRFLTGHLTVVHTFLVVASSLVVHASTELYAVCNAHVA